MIVIGIDPGSRHFGYGILDSIQMKLIFASTLNLDHTLEIPRRLHRIYDTLHDVIEHYRPSEMALEKAFVGKKIPSSFILNYTRAVALLVAAQRGLEVYEYSATEIKKALTGYGRAHKVQVRSMVKNFLSFNGKISYDCADALAVAICHVNSRNSYLYSKKLKC